jgi:hypothetical protein
VAGIKMEKYSQGSIVVYYRETADELAKKFD